MDLLASCPSSTTSGKIRYLTESASKYPQITILSETGSPAFSVSFEDTNSKPEGLMKRKIQPRIQILVLKLEEILLSLSLNTQFLPIL